MMHWSPALSLTRVPARVSLGDGLGDVTTNGLLASHRAHRGGGALPRHEHGAAYLCVVLAGGYAQTTSTEIDCRRGSLVAHPAGHVHANRFGAEPTRCVNMYFDANWLEDPALTSLFAEYGQVQLDPRDETLIRLEREMATSDVGAQLTVASAVLDLAARAVRRSNTDVAPAWLRRVRDAIADDLARTPDLTTLAAEAGVHPAHLCRAFRDATSETIGSYSRRLRLEAADAMIAGSASIAEIATATGFYDQAHLARCFRRQYGTSPSARRRQLTS